MITTETRLTFSKHIRNRASGLVNLLPFPHHYQNVLSAIANIDWQRDNGGEIANSIVYLQFADINDDKSAIAYLDWLEPKLRRSLSHYEQMINCHKHEVTEFIKNFERT